MENGENAENITNSMMANLGDIIDWMQRVAFIWSIIFAVCVFCFTLVIFRKKCTDLTKEQIKAYSLNGKYIPGLFVELNDSKECIRAFCFSRLWENRVVRRYNALFNDKLGKELLNVYSEQEVKLKLSTRINPIELNKELYKTLVFLNKVEKRELECNPEYKNTNMRYECFGGGYTRALEHIEKMSSFLCSDYMIVNGTAGNGKSMMLCTVGEQLANGKETVFFCNARDIKKDLYSYINCQLFHPKIISVAGLLWKIQSIIHRIVKKKIYIIVDAINENESKEFLESVSEDIKKLISFGCIKIIVSCRSEYFDYKYKRYLLDGLEDRACFLYLQDGEYTPEAKSRLITNYASHYNFTGSISDSVIDKITNQLLLVRILFEVYEGKSENIYELNKYQLYKKYIDNIHDQHVEKLIKNLAEYMFKHEQYENVKLYELCNGENEYETIDASILVCRNLIMHQGTIRESTEEVINFVYDEMRDYLLTKVLLDNCVDDVHEISDSKVKKILEKLNSQGAICFEGIINYLFNHYYAENNFQMLEYLLFEIIKPRDDSIDKFRNRRSRTLLSWGLNLLFETEAINSELGKKYIDFVLQDNPGKEGQKLLTYLLKQEMKKGDNTLSIILDSLLRVDNEDDFKRRLDNTLAEWQGEGVSVGELIDIEELLLEKNKDGADRFSIYMFIVTKCFDWKNRSRVEEYLSKKANQESINEYVSKIRSVLVENNKV